MFQKGYNKFMGFLIQAFEESFVPYSLVKFENNVLSCFVDFPAIVVSFCV